MDFDSFLDPLFPLVWFQMDVGLIVNEVVEAHLDLLDLEVVEAEENLLRVDRLSFHGEDDDDVSLRDPFEGQSYYEFALVFE